MVTLEGRWAGNLLKFHEKLPGEGVSFTVVFSHPQL